MRKEVRGRWYVRTPYRVCVSKSNRGEMGQGQDADQARAFSSIYIFDMDSVIKCSQKAGEEIEKENDIHSCPLFPISLTYSSF